MRDSEWQGVVSDGTRVCCDQCVDVFLVKYGIPTTDLDGCRIPSVLLFKDLM